MADLRPTIGGDNNDWGAKLNAFLAAAHNPDGTLIPVVIDTVSSTAYNLVLSDAGHRKNTTSDSAVTVTVQADSTVQFAVGDVVDFTQLGMGTVVLAAADNTVTILSPAGVTTSQRYSTISLIFQGAGTWLLAGDLGSTQG